MKSIKWMFVFALLLSVQFLCTITISDGFVNSTSIKEIMNPVFMDGEYDNKDVLEQDSLSNSSQSRDTFGTQVGSFNGVIAYSNGSTSYNSGTYNYYSGTCTGLEWQCVEFVNRYYLMIYGINIRVAGHNANDYFPNASQHSLTPYANGNSSIPQVGDIICSNAGTYGHVALVREVGLNYIKVIQQNWYNSSGDNSFQLSLTYSGGVYTVGNFSTTYTVAGWLRNGSTQPTGCTWYVTPSGGTQSVLPSNYIFWNQYSYTVAGVIDNLPAGYGYAVCLYNSNGDYIAYSISNQTSSSFSFTFGGLSEYNGTGFKFKLVPQFQPNNPIPGTESNSWCTGPYPTLNLSGPSNSSYTQGSSLGLSWSVSGGVNGLTNGGWSSSAQLRFQWYQGSTPLNNISPNSNLTDWSKSITADQTPGTGYRIGVCNIGSGSSLPDGIPSAFSSTFQITSPSYSVYVSSSPSGASIYVNGSSSGYTTPHTFTLTQGGSATYTVQSTGYTWSPSSLVVTNITSDQSVNFVGTLLTYTVNITSSPTDADIYVNGSDSGYNTSHTFTLNYGSNATYTVQKTGYSFTPASFAVSNIQSNQSQNFTGTLIVPGTAVLSAPSNGATGLPYASQTLSWSAGSGNPPTGYKVYFDTVNPPTSLVSTQAGTTYTTSVLNPTTTFYWKIVAYNGTGDAPSSSIWSFSTAAVTSYNVDITSSPSGAAIYVGGSSSGFTTPHTFSLTQGSSATYTVQLSGYTWTPANFAVTNIQANTSQNFVGTMAIPGAAVLTAPSNGATGLSYASQTLTWTAGSGSTPTGYKVYFGTANPPTILVSTQAGTSYTTSALNPSTTYFWKVIAYNGIGDAPSSSIWSFATTAETILPTLTAFQINNGEESTSNTNVTLHNTATNATHYMASENSNFSGASWQTYSAIPSFTLSTSPGLKTVYLKVKNANAESGVLSDQVTLVHNQPSWIPITGNQYTAIGFFSVYVDGVLFTGESGQNEYNLLGAFNSAGECLGVGTWQSNLFYLDILNNNIGSTVYFKIYNGTTDEISSCNETVVFSDNEVYGTPESPVNLTVTTSVSLTYNLVTGWNWISIPIQFSNLSPSSVFASLGSNIATVKTQTQSALRSTGGTWYGTLTSITGMSSYLVQMNTGATLTLTGYPIGPETPISLVANWNWPAYLPTVNGVTISTAFGSLVPNVSIVKTQSQSKIYSTSTGTWIGSLTSVNPGQGIKVQMLSSDDLLYSSSRFDFDTQPYDLQSNGYPDNMIMHAVLFDNSHNPININNYDIFIVDITNSIRSIGTPITVDSHSFIYFTIGGSSEDEYLVPYIRNRITGEGSYSASFEFVPDAIIGSCESPQQLVFNIVTDIVEDHQTAYCLNVQVIPNPIVATGKLKLENLPKSNSNVSIDIYDIRGKKVQHYANIKQTEIDIPDNLSSGVYFVKVTTGSITKTTKFVKMK